MYGHGDCVARTYQNFFDHIAGMVAMADIKLLHGIEAAIQS